MQIQNVINFICFCCPSDFVMRKFHQISFIVSSDDNVGINSSHSQMTRKSKTKRVVYSFALPDGGGGDGDGGGDDDDRPNRNINFPDLYNVHDDRAACIAVCSN